MNLIPDNILHAICWTLLHSLWQGLLLAVIAGIVMVLSKRAGSALRYNLLCGLLIIFMASITFTFCLQMRPPAPGGPSITNVVGTGTTVQGNGLTEGQWPGDIQKTGTPLQHAIDSFVRYFNEHASLVVLVWFIVFLARFVKIAGGLVYVQRIRYYQTNPVPAEWQLKLTELLKRLQISQPVMLLESALIKIPVVVGFLKPTILIPVGMLMRLSPLQVESILIHELAHIRRRDYLFNLLQNLVDTIFFFNPALIWVSSLIRSERENCCDDIAIGETRSRKKFVEALVSFHEYSRAGQGYALSFAAGQSQLVRRVKRIVYKKNHSLNPGERILLMGGLLLLSAAFMTIDNSRPATALAKKSKTAPIVFPAKVTVPHSQTGATAKVVKKTDARPERTNPTGTNATKMNPAEMAAPGVPAPVHVEKRPSSSVTKDTTVPTPKLSARGSSEAFRFEDLSMNELMECREHGVTAEYIHDFEKMGYRGVSLDKFIQLKDHGVNAEFIHDLNELGYTAISLDQARTLFDHGVSAFFISELNGIGYASLTLAKAIKLRDHGVTAEFIKGFLKLGYKNISIDMAIRLVDHGVNSRYIETFNKRTGAHLELEEYIHLRDAGIKAS